MAKYLLLDGNSLAYRAFFALPPDMATASGQVTNAVYGFTSMLVNLIKDHQPDGLAVALDLPAPTFRHQMATDYKAGRATTPDVLIQQMGIIRQVLDTLAIPVFAEEGYEADDVLATLATSLRDRADEVVVVTGDRDAYQLVEDPYIKVLYNRRGVSDYALYDEAGIVARTGVTPSQYPHYAALRGDPSDNLAGVPGVGEKTAARLINDYGDIDGIYAHLDQATPKLRAALAENEDLVRHNALMTPLVRDVALDLDTKAMTLGGWDATEAEDLFRFLEFKTLWSRLTDVAGLPGHSAPDRPGSEPLPPLEVEISRPGSVPVACAELAELAVVNPGAGVEVETRSEAGAPVVTGERVEFEVGGPAIHLAWVGTPARSELLGVAITDGSPQVVWLSAELISHPDVAQALGGLLGPEAQGAVAAHRAKDAMRGLGWVGIDFVALGTDTAIAAYLIDPAGGQYLLDDLVPRYLGLSLDAPGGPAPGELDLEGLGNDVAEAAARRARAVSLLAAPLGAALAHDGMEDLYRQIERPLVRVLARMEDVGIGVDKAYLSDLAEELGFEVASLDTEIQALAGEPFKVNSTPQLRRILFDQLGLVPQKRTKTGFSTDAASLERLRDEHPIIEKLLRYREVEKLRSTYGASLLAEIGPDGRIHASFNQTVARTGRLSSESPNLHNIPIRSEEGRRFRRAFVAAPGYRLLVADYNQVELRVIAHLSGDPGLVEAFGAGVDIHTATAARLFGTEPADVTLGQRSKAKMVSYGLAYGMEAYGLSQRLGVPVEEAAVILAAYFEAFPKVRAYMDATVAEARSRGYTETLFGRRRPIPELTSTNFRVRQAGERQAMNAAIQGLAADLFKVALVRLDHALTAGGCSARLILQVHDEVLVEVPPSEEEMVEEMTRQAMTGAGELDVPLEVNLSWGQSWADAKS